MSLKINFNEDDLATEILAMIPGPVWHDGCQHDKDSFVASFELLNHKQKRMNKYDLYLFQDIGSGRQHVCIRYGNEEGEYISPGHLGGFLTRSNGTYEPYATAIRILLSYGDVEWKLKKE